MNNLQTTVETKAASSPWNFDKDIVIFYSVIALITIGSISLRFWDLDRFPYPVFDEVHFPRFAEQYLEGKPPNDGHPPLGKYLIMAGILLFGHNEIGYRIVTAGIGSLVPLLVMGLVYQFQRHRWLTVIAGFFAFADGLFLVESRYGLLNNFLVAFGLVSQIFLWKGLQESQPKRSVYLCFSGLMLGAAAGIKWNGMGFWLLVCLLITLVKLVEKFAPQHLKDQGALVEIGKLPWWQYGLFFGVLPAVMYIAQWTPHLLLLLPAMEPSHHGIEHFWDFWRYLGISNYHIYVWNTSEIALGTPDKPMHPYCSSVLSWPVLARSVGYYFHIDNDIWQAVQGLGNPLLWWFSLIAVITLTVKSLRHFCLTDSYILLGFAANYLPWLVVKRCLFIYHYMSPVTFAFIALAVVTLFLLECQQKLGKVVGISIILLVFSSQVFFMPIWLGLPLSPNQFYQRMWFRPDGIPGLNWI